MGVQDDAEADMKNAIAAGLLVLTISAAATTATAAPKPTLIATRVHIGHGTSWGGFCFWTALIDVYSDGSYNLYYETDCGGNGRVVPRDRFGHRRTDAELKALTPRTLAARKAAANAPRFAQHLLLERRRKRQEMPEHHN